MVAIRPTQPRSAWFFPASSPADDVFLVLLPRHSWSGCGPGCAGTKLQPAAHRRRYRDGAGSGPSHF